MDMNKNLRGTYFEVLEYIRGKTPRENLAQSESILDMFFEQ